MLSTDYLIIGSGAFGMTFVDQMLTEDPDAHFIIVDRHSAPGGHWNDAYSFVRLHQPSAYYGVGSRALGGEAIDTEGFNAGYHQLASGAEVRRYFGRLMRERFLPSGRVSYFPDCDYRGGGRFVSRLSGAARSVWARRRIVDTTAARTSVPSTHTPAFEVAERVRLLTPNGLPHVAGSYERFAIVGGGKTAMDTGVWLLENGFRPEAIRWFMPRDSWLIDRATTQPGDAFAGQTLGGQLAELEAAAEATSADDLFERMEAAGHVLRLDRRVRPGVFRCATMSRAEADSLRRITDVIRKGYVRRISRNAVFLDGGLVASEPGRLFIDCSARALGQRTTTPVFAGRTITLQTVRACKVSVSAAVIAHVEACYQGDAVKNALCRPIALPDTPQQWLRLQLADLRAQRRWSEDKALRGWLSQHRLSGPALGPQAMANTEGVRHRMRLARPLAEANLERLLGEAPRAPAAAPIGATQDA